MRRRSRNVPSGAKVTSTAELTCSATPTIATRCMRPFATVSSYNQTMTRRLLAVLIALLPSSALAQPLADHHQHLFSPALAKLINGTPISAAELVKHLDEAGIKRAVVLSTAYSFSNPSRKVENDYDFVRAD